MGRAATRARGPGSDVASTRYEDDLYAWVQEQVEFLQAGHVAGLDLKNIAEELGDVGKAQSWRLWSILRVLVMHMLKWDQQPERQSVSWVRSIREQRRRYATLLETSPSLKARRDDVLASVYPTARDWAADETHIPEDECPARCPYTWDDILDRPFEVDDRVRERK